MANDMAFAPLAQARASGAVGAAVAGEDLGEIAGDAALKIYSANITHHAALEFHRNGQRRSSRGQARRSLPAGE